MKTIRIILFVLIIIGLALLATQKFWVPKLVDKIISSESAPIIVPTTAPEPQANITLVDGRQCYTYSHDATKTEPYKVSEFIDITIKGSTVTGTKTGNQSGPDMANGYSGKISGTLLNNAITAIYSYTIEGSIGREQEIYKPSPTGIDKIRYPLVNTGNILVPDTAKEYKLMHYSRVECEGSN